MRYLNRFRNSHLAGLGRALADKGAEQGRLSRPVGTDEAHYFAAPNPRGEVVQQHPLADLDAHVLGYQDLVTTARVSLEPEGHGSVLAGRRAQPAHPHQPAAAALRLRAL